jgi:hypothetical protein
MTGEHGALMLALRLAAAVGFALAAGCSRSSDGGAPPRGGGGAGGSPPAGPGPPGGGAALVLERRPEPREGAFSILVPRGWLLEGGILRVDPGAAGGPANAIEAKVDLAIKRDAAGTVMLRSLPDLLYFDARRSPAGQLGLYPPGSTYQGMAVLPVLRADRFLVEVALPRAHPGITGLQVLDRQPSPETATRYGQRTTALLQRDLGFSYDAATVAVAYVEAGVRYRELLFAIVQDWGELGAGMWGNRETVLARAPEAELERWLPVLRTIQGSVRMSPSWMAGEIRGQMERNRVLRDTQQEVERIDREMVEHRQRTMAEIQNDMYLDLTGQEEYVNPHTGEVERDTGQWRYRWVNDAGEVVFSDHERYDPNQDLDLHRQGWKRSPVRERFPR